MKFCFLPAVAKWNMCGGMSHLIDQWTYGIRNTPPIFPPRQLGAPIFPCAPIQCKKCTPVIALERKKSHCVLKEKSVAQKSKSQLNENLLRVGKKSCLVFWLTLVINCAALWGVEAKFQMQNRLAFALGTRAAGVRPFSFICQHIHTRRRNNPPRDTHFVLVSTHLSKGGHRDGVGIDRLARRYRNIKRFRADNYITRSTRVVLSQRNFACAFPADAE